MPDSNPSDPLDQRVAEVLDAGLQLGASLARTLAGATGTRDVEPTGKPAIDDIVTFGTATAGNLVGLVASGARAGMRVSNRATSAAGVGDDDAAGATPILTAGSTLRVPLLVENTGQTPTRALALTVASLVRTDCEDGEQCDCLTSEGVSFNPETLVVAARDFEKLTVRIHAPEDTPPGDYVASISAGDGWFSSEIPFAVIAPR